jgi:hypothetical protein
MEEFARAAARLVCIISALAVVALVIAGIDGSSTIERGDSTTSRGGQARQPHGDVPPPSAAPDAAPVDPAGDPASGSADVQGIADDEDGNTIVPPSEAQLETCNYVGAPGGCESYDLNGDGQYGLGDSVDSEDPGVDDDNDGQVDELGESCPEGCLADMEGSLP